MSAVSLKNIKAGYGKNEILKDVSFSAEAGECVGIVGFNGCGKSTLLSVLAGIRKATDGSLEYCGTTVYSKADGIFLKKAISSYTGFVPQEPPLIPELSVLDNLKLWYSSKDALTASLENGFLSRLGVADFLNKRVDRLSGGMKKRAAIGLAMAENPKILLLDEPGASLDIAVKSEIADFLKGYLADGNTVIIASHEDSELDLCDKLIAIKGGISEEIDCSLRGTDLVRRFQ